jgi:hypothetical protein
MSSLTIAFIVFACVFGSGLLGLHLRRRLPDHHLSDESIGAVKLGTGLIATLAALVLGLLIASAKGSYDRFGDEFTQTAAKVVMLDRTLAQYGPETKLVRELLRQTYAAVVEVIFDGDGKGAAGLDAPERDRRMDQLQQRLRELAPKNDRQRSAQSDALALGRDLAQTRWLVIAQGQGAIPVPFRVVLVLWLAVMLAGFGLASAGNATVIAVLFVCALSVSGAIFLIDEMNNPLQGLMQISSTPSRNALSHLGE